MVFIRKIKKKTGIYLAEVEGKRIDGKVVQKFIRYIGKVPESNPNITSKVEKKQMRDVEIVQKLLNGKSKNDLAILYEVDIKTVSNIEKRYKKEGIQGLIHTRKSNVETVKVSTPEQAAIITDVVQHPDKTAKEIKETTAAKSTISAIEKLISPVLDHMKLKKKIVLEIE
jgi:transposase